MTARVRQFASAHPSVRAVVLGMLAMALVGCDDGAGETTGTLDADGTLSLTVPPMLQVRAVNQANLVPTVRVNGDRQNIDPTTVGFRSSVVIPEGQRADIRIDWVEVIGFQRLTLAEYFLSLASVDRDRSIRVFAEDYDTDQLDIDNDGVSNLAERIGNTDPFDASDPGPNFAQVFLPYIDPQDAPQIDGDYDGVWDRAQYRDRNRFRLDIDNLMIDQGATRLDGNTEYRWAAMHDGASLYLLVFAEGANGQTPFGDSTPDDWNDDALEIFIDGDNSKTQDYDGVNDFQLILPLTPFDELAANGNAVDNGRYLLGFKSAPLDPSSFDFATCLCEGAQQLYEVRIDLTALGIQVDRTFGFELQLDDDRDGGLREAKWGWFHPSREDSDVDNTKDSPQFMGTMRLQRPIGQ